MYNEIQKLNDKYLELKQLLTDFDTALANTTDVDIVYDDENGNYYSNVTVMDEDGLYELKKIYDRLEKIIN